MAQLQMVCTLRTGTQERWRRLSQEVAGSRRAQFEASCRQAGITQVQVWLVQLAHSELLLVKMNMQEPQQTLKALATSKRPFERWLREQLQVLLGWSVQEVLPVPQGDLLLAWVDSVSSYAIGCPVEGESITRKEKEDVTDYEPTATRGE
jgi:hypothetical protein